MGNYPVLFGMLVTLSLVMTVVMVVVPRMRTAGTDRKYAHLRLGELARRMGLQIIEGDRRGGAAGGARGRGRAAAGAEVAAGGHPAARPVGGAGRARPPRPG